jgi:hypothetical protein
MNGMLNSPYAVAVDTDLVQDAMAQEDAARLREFSPEWLLKRITPAEAAAGVVRGVEERKPRIFVPGWWRWASHFRGALMPLLDRGMERDTKMAAFLRDLDERAGVDEAPINAPDGDAINKP